jgi:hypothetical protein
MYTYIYNIALTFHVDVCNIHDECIVFIRTGPSPNLMPPPAPSALNVEGDDTTKSEQRFTDSLMMPPPSYNRRQREVKRRDVITTAMFVPSNINQAVEPDANVMALPSEGDVVSDVNFHKHTMVSLPKDIIKSQDIVPESFRNSDDDNVVEGTSNDVLTTEIFAAADCSTSPERRKSYFEEEDGNEMLLPPPTLNDYTAVTSQDISGTMTDKVEEDNNVKHTQHSQDPRNSIASNTSTKVRPSLGEEADFELPEDRTLHNTEDPRASIVSNSSRKVQPSLGEEGAFDLPQGLNDEVPTISLQQETKDVYDSYPTDFSRGPNTHINHNSYPLSESTTPDAHNYYSAEYLNAYYSNYYYSQGYYWNGHESINVATNQHSAYNQVDGAIESDVQPVQDSAISAEVEYHDHITNSCNSNDLIPTTNNSISHSNTVTECINENCVQSEAEAHQINTNLSDLIHEQELQKILSKKANILKAGKVTLHRGGISISPPRLPSPFKAMNKAIFSPAVEVRTLSPVPESDGAENSPVNNNLNGAFSTSQSKNTKKSATLVSSNALSYKKMVKEDNRAKGGTSKVNIPIKSRSSVVRPRGNAEAVTTKHSITVASSKQGNKNVGVGLRAPLTSTAREVKNGRFSMSPFSLRH